MTKLGFNLVMLSLLMVPHFLVAQADTFSERGTCSNPYIIEDSLTNINLGTITKEKIWLTFVSEENDFFISFNKSDNTPYNYMIFRYSGPNFCEQIALKSLTSERNKVCDKTIEIDAASTLSHENINRGLCACEQCCHSHAVFKGIAGVRYMAVVYFPENNVTVSLSSNDNPLFVSAPTNETPVRVININEVEIGETIVLDNIYFQPGSDEILRNSFPSLVALFEFLNSNRSVRIEIQGHVNAPNELPDLNHSGNLAGRRARAVYEFLIEKGIGNDRLTYKGYGNTQMIYPNTRIESEMEKNRRVEIKILSK
ncbi:MAG: OmpA family protein [Bacteroidales bacterium]|nr:OmpA family protein [Bacteroidales bacterium]